MSDPGSLEKVLREPQVKDKIEPQQRPTIGGEKGN